MHNNLDDELYKKIKDDAFYYMGIYQCPLFTVEVEDALIEKYGEEATASFLKKIREENSR